MIFCDILMVTINMISEGEFGSVTYSHSLGMKHVTSAKQENAMLLQGYHRSFETLVNSL